eukprot:CAMPEP_0194288822 /NCGR_PEP_ID=MMETSP0169-20130528/37684_1 /TAXON_ID=218684 /ORGANISM="Corethron pennatum, Strain L29A3" /LENGTH=158 /DNA_ID=CAMNT_0039035925 /DNA_START=35 /DNA_END=511 /DNA_ORIENTATION=+
MSKSGHDGGGASVPAARGLTPIDGAGRGVPPSPGADVLGFLCNDMNGLCITRSGEMSSAGSDAYTSLARIASRLAAGYSAGGDDYFHLPVVTVETADYTLVVKEHDVQEGGLTVAVKVPPSAASGPAAAAAAAAVVDRRPTGAGASTATATDGGAVGA